MKDEGNGKRGFLVSAILVLILVLGIVQFFPANAASSKASSSELLVAVQVDGRISSFQPPKIQVPVEPMVQSTLKILRTINTVPGLFNGLPTGSNITVNYGFHPLGVFWYSNPQGNFTAGISTLKCGAPNIAFPLSTGGKVYSNSTHVAYNLTPIGGCTGDIWLYFKKQVGALNYPSTDMKVIITGTLSTSGNTLNLVFLSSSLVQTTDLTGRTKHQIRMGGTNLGFDWSDSASLNPTFKLSTKTLSYSVGTSFTIDPTTITTTTTNGAFAYGFQRETCYLNGRWVASFSDGTNLIQSSATNSAFTTGVVSNTIRAVTVGQNFGSWCDTTNNKWGYAFGTGANLFVRTYAFNTDGTLTADFAEVDIAGQLPAGHNNGITYPSFYFSGTTDLWITTGVSVSGANRWVDVMYCTTTCGTASNWSNKRSYDTGQGANDWSGLLTPLSTAAKKSLIMGQSGGSIALQIQTTSDTGGTWSTLRATTSSYNLNTVSAVALSDTTHFCGVVSSNPTYFNFGLSPTGAPTEVTEDSSSSASRNCAISVGGTTDLVIAYSEGTAIYTQSSTNSGSSFATKVSQASGETSITDNGASYAITSNAIQTIWVAGSASPWNVRFMEVTLTVSQTITSNVSPAGQATFTFTLSGASVSPTSAAGDGSAVSITCLDGGTVTITAPAAGADTRARFAGDSTTSTFTCNTTNDAVTYYSEQRLSVSYSINGGGSPTAPDITRIVLGVSGTTALTTTATDLWVDAATSWSTTNPLSGAGANQRFQANSGVLGPASAGLSVAPVYYNQYTNNLAYSLTGGGTFNAPTLDGNSFGSTTTITLPTVAAGFYFDSGAVTSVTNPLTGSSASSTERGRTQTAAPTINSGGGSTTFAYYHQYQPPISYSVVGGGSGYSAPTFTCKQFGATFTYTATTTTTAQWVDNSCAYTFTNPLTGSTSSEQWQVATGASGTIADATALAPSYQRQYLVTLGTGLSGTSGFVNAGLTDAISGGGYSNTWTINRAEWFYLVGAENLQLGVSCSTTTGPTRTAGGVTFGTTCTGTVTADIFLPATANLQISSMFDGASSSVTTSAISSTVTEGSGATGAGWAIYIASTIQAQPTGGSGTPAPSDTGGGGGGGGVGFSQVVYVPSPVPVAEITLPIPINVTSINNQPVLVSGIPIFDIPAIIAFIEQPFIDLWQWLLVSVNGGVTSTQTGISSTGTSSLLWFLSAFSGDNLLIVIATLTTVSVIFVATRRRGMGGRGVSAFSPFEPSYSSGSRVRNPNRAVSALASIAVTSVISVVAFWFVLPRAGIHTPLEVLPVEVALAFTVVLGIVSGLVVALLGRL